MAKSMYTDNLCDVSHSGDDDANQYSSIMSVPTPSPKTHTTSPMPLKRNFPNERHEYISTRCSDKKYTDARNIQNSSSMELPQTENQQPSIDEISTTIYASPLFAQLRGRPCHDDDEDIFLSGGHMRGKVTTRFPKRRMGVFQSSADDVNANQFSRVGRKRGNGLSSDEDVLKTLAFSALPIISLLWKNACRNELVVSRMLSSKLAPFMPTEQTNLRGFVQKNIFDFTKKEYTHTKESKSLVLSYGLEGLPWNLLEYEDIIDYINRTGKSGMKWFCRDYVQISRLNKTISADKDAREKSHKSAAAFRKLMKDLQNEEERYCEYNDERFIRLFMTDDLCPDTIETPSTSSEPGDRHSFDKKDSLAQTTDNLWISFIVPGMVKILDFYTTLISKVVSAFLAALSDGRFIYHLMTIESIHETTDSDIPVFRGDSSETQASSCLSDILDEINEMASVLGGIFRFSSITDAARKQYNHLPKFKGRTWWISLIRTYLAETVSGGGGGNEDETDKSPSSPLSSRKKEILLCSKNLGLAIGKFHMAYSSLCMLNIRDNSIGENIEKLLTQHQLRSGYIDKMCQMRKDISGDFNDGDVFCPWNTDNSTSVATSAEKDERESLGNLCAMYVMQEMVANLTNFFDMHLSTRGLVNTTDKEDKSIYDEDRESHCHGSDRLCVEMSCMSEFLCSGFVHSPEKFKDAWCDFATMFLWKLFSSGFQGFAESTLASNDDLPGNKKTLCPEPTNFQVPVSSAMFSEENRKPSDWMFRHILCNYFDIPLDDEIIGKAISSPVERAGGVIRLCLAFTLMDEETITNTNINNGTTGQRRHEHGRGGKCVKNQYVTRPPPIYRTTNSICRSHATKKRELVELSLRFITLLLYGDQVMEKIALSVKSYHDSWEKCQKQIRKKKRTMTTSVSSSTTSATAAADKCPVKKRKKNNQTSK
jgi:hypothetical protein